MLRPVSFNAGRVGGGGRRKGRR